MKKLFSVGTLVSSLSLPEQFNMAKEAGFDGVDYILTLTDLWVKPTQVSALSKKYHIPVYGVHVPLIFVCMIPPFLYERLLHTLEMFPDCKIFNLHVSCFSYPFQGSDAYVKRFLDLTKQINIQLSFESNPSQFPFTFYPKQTRDPDLFASYCIKNGLPINLDLSHIASCGYDVLTFFRRYYKQINVIHISDFKKSVQHLPLGEGSLPLEELFQEIKKVSFNGTVIFELYKFPDDKPIERRTLRIKKSLEYFNKFNS